MQHYDFADIECHRKYQRATNFPQSSRLTAGPHGYQLRNFLFPNKLGIYALAAGFFPVTLNEIHSNLIVAQRHFFKKITSHRIR
jgi:hypothetical protein